ncbi:type I methionyl aminopeptidase [Chitinophaga oryzae]|uniref:Methionine aminopeptidase n=1 Tax=Chitinophaga oryzae TaxID=2725414 RepID=A0AAE7D653_9BACT|nr:type I methionyl aminopeptidase [Chitinophaga oryzae]QJB31364.1 type I methionyl aminopeptidase [Chitinophaga oryzae]QJB37849.1 type I methionyl aminopeptidase [Chitinophaga oryzae]
MSITSEAELQGMKRISEVVAITLKEMRNYTKPGMSAKEVDEYGGEILRKYGAKSAPKLTYGFPGWTCISINNEIAHGIPHATKILREGDLVNIDVSAELDGYWADNGGSFVLGNDVHLHLPLVNASRNILYKALRNIRGGVKIADIGKLIEKEAAKAGFTVIRNLAGHGVGRGLHEPPEDILNCYERRNKERFRKNSVVAVETFISTRSNYANQANDGWTLIGNKGGFVAQHEHTIVITDGEPIILTADNEI